MFVSTHEDCSFWSSASPPSLAAPSVSLLAAEGNSASPLARPPEGLAEAATRHDRCLGVGALHEKKHVPPMSFTQPSTHQPTSNYNHMFLLCRLHHDCIKDSKTQKKRAMTSIHPQRLGHRSRRRRRLRHRLRRHLLRRWRRLGRRSWRPRSLFHPVAPGEAARVVEPSSKSAICGLRGCLFPFQDTTSWSWKTKPRDHSKTHKCIESYISFVTLPQLTPIVK